MWYNYASASANTIVGGSDSTIATEDICPSGWHLPGYDTDGSAGSINSLTGNLIYKVAFSPVIGGTYLNTSLDDTGCGSWWSDTASASNNRHYLHSGVVTNNQPMSVDSPGGWGRHNGRYIRCVR